MKNQCLFYILYKRSCIPTSCYLFYRAGDEARTRDLQLGRLSLYQLSYSRNFASPDGFEPPTYSLTANCSPAELRRHYVGKTGFEPATSWSQTKRDTELRYFPIFLFPTCQRTLQIYITKVIKTKNPEHFVFRVFKFWLLSIPLFKV